VFGSKWGLVMPDVTEAETFWLILHQSELGLCRPLTYVLRALLPSH
jgi:hypothetical protein